MNEHSKKKNEKLIRNLRHRPLSLRIYPDEVLRKISEPVKTFDSALRDFANEMVDFMIHHGGIGLAAPQVGVLQRIVVAGTDKRAVCLINPELVSGEGSENMVEGCLSLPETKVDVARYTGIEIRGRDLKGEEFSISSNGMMAKVFQHEVDHLNGILICDHSNETRDNRAGEPGSGQDEKQDHA